MRRDLRIAPYLYLGNLSVCLARLGVCGSVAALPGAMRLVADYGYFG
jgi:hypothetical protein